MTEEAKVVSKADYIQHLAWSLGRGKHRVELIQVGWVSLIARGRGDRLRASMSAYLSALRA